MNLKAIISITTTNRKKCVTCKKVKLISDFKIHRKSKNGKVYCYKCKNCQNIYMREYYKNHPERYFIYRGRYKEKYDPIKTKKYNYAYRLACKERVLLYYGNKCNCCGETEIKFLTMDHINNDGNIHRKKERLAKNIFQWLENNNYPQGFQILCMNCNFAKGHFGECPHKDKL